MIEQEIEIRCYTKSELAAIYFPELGRNSGVQKLMRWVKHNPALQAELSKCGYATLQRTLSAREVRLVVAYLGAP